MAEFLSAEEEGGEITNSHSFELYLRYRKSSCAIRFCEIFRENGRFSSVYSLRSLLTFFTGEEKDSSPSILHPPSLLLPPRKSELAKERGGGRRDCADPLLPLSFSSPPHPQLLLLFLLASSSPFRFVRRGGGEAGETESTLSERIMFCYSLFLGRHRWRIFYSY